MLIRFNCPATAWLYSAAGITSCDSMPYYVILRIPKMLMGLIILRIHKNTNNTNKFMILIILLMTIMLRMQIILVMLIMQ